MRKTCNDYEPKSKEQIMCETCRLWYNRRADAWCEVFDATLESTRKDCEYYQPREEE